MTIETVLQIALRRAGLSESVTKYMKGAREYFNMGKDDIGSRHQWRWLLKKSANITTSDGVRTQNLASDVLYPLTFYNVTDNHPIEIISPLSTYNFDPNDDEEGGIKAVALAGIDTATTGYYQVSWTPIPDTTGDVIFYQYSRAIADIVTTSSADDSDDLKLYFPVWAQQAIIFYIAAQYKGEKGDLNGEAQDMRNYEQKVAEALKLDLKLDSGRRQRLPRRRSRGASQGVSFTVQAGTL